MRAAAECDRADRVAGGSSPTRTEATLGRHDAEFVRGLADGAISAYPHLRVPGSMPRIAPAVTWASG
jgi:hypothetical protein